MKIQKNQKVFLSFAYTGQRLEDVESRMAKVCGVLKNSGIDFYCNLYDESTFDFDSPGQFLRSALEELRDCDVLLAIVCSDHKSQGQLMEIGAAKALGITVVLLLHESAKGTTYLDDPLISGHVVEWSDDESLLSGITSCC